MNSVIVAEVHGVYALAPETCPAEQKERVQAAMETLAKAVLPEGTKEVAQDVREDLLSYLAYNLAKSGHNDLFIALRTSDF